MLIAYCHSGYLLSLLSASSESDLDANAGPAGAPQKVSPVGSWGFAPAEVLALELVVVVVVSLSKVCQGCLDSTHWRFIYIMDFSFLITIASLSLFWYLVTLLSLHFPLPSSLSARNL